MVSTVACYPTWARSAAHVGVPALAEAAELLDQMDAAPDIDSFLALDARFHVALAQAAGNSVVSAMMASLRGAIENYAGELTGNLPDWNATCSRLRAEHRAILAAVNNNDGGKAAELVAAHIQGFYKEAGVGSNPSPK